MWSRRTSNLAALIAVLLLGVSLHAQSSLLLLGAGGPSGATPPSGQSFTDDFSTDPFGSPPRWTWVENSGAWDSTNEEMEPWWDNGNIRTVYNAPMDSLEHEAQVTYLGTGTFSSAPGVMVRASADGADGYTAHYRDGTGGGTPVISFGRWNAGSFTAGIHEVSLPGSWTPNVFITIRLVAEGGNGANVVLKAWIDIGTASKPSDPGWVGSLGTPDATYTDTDGSRLDDDTVHLYTGIGGSGAGGDSRHDFWKGRDISAR